MLITNAVTRRWTVDEFNRLSGSGIFAPDERVELIEGELVVMTPPGSEHSYSIRRGTKELERLYGSTHDLSVQCPLVVSSISEPQPDFALLPGGFDSPSTHPETADLVLEVAHSSLAYDRGEKASMYARAGIEDYWIVNIESRVLEVYREPAPDGSGYRSLQTFAVGESVQPLRIPGPPCPVSMFF